MQHYTFELMCIRRVLFVLIMVIAVTTSSAFAQTQDDPKGGLILAAGPTYLTVPKGVSRSMGVGFTAGLFAVLPITKTYKLQPEIQWEHQQSKVLGTDRKFDYLNIPILVRMSLFKGLYITEGPAFHIPVKATAAGVDVKDNTKTNTSITIGVGKRAGRVGIEGRWDSGLRRTQKTITTGDVATRPRSILAVVAIGF